MTFHAALVSMTVRPYRKFSDGFFPKSELGSLCFFQICAITYETRHRHAHWDPLGLRAVRRVGTQEVAVRRLVLGRGHRQQAGIWRDPGVSKLRRFQMYDDDGEQVIEMDGDRCCGYWDTVVDLV